MEKKITKRVRFETLLTFAEVQADAGMVDFIKNEISLLAKKNTSDKKPTAQQTRNTEIQRAIVSLMRSEPDRLFAISELEVADFVKPDDKMTNQRMSSLVRQLLPEYGKGVAGTGEVVRVMDKRKVFFKANPDFVEMEGA